MKLVVTIDVEEDQWGVTPPRYATVHNVRRLPALQTMLDTFGVVPTYLLTYPVASDPHAIGILQDILAGDGCEVGAHCHPWNTPPYEERLSKYNSMLCNLPGELQFRKLQRLHGMIQAGLQTTPVAFRSGRWGFDPTVAGHLVRLGYRVDTSITPYTSWARCHGPDFSRFSPRSCDFTYGFPSDPDSKARLVEVPPTIGYLHGEFDACARMEQRLGAGALRHLKIGGILSTLRLLRKVWLSPEMETPARMIQLVRQMMRQGYEVLNLVFHSSAMLKGCTPFVRTESDERLFLEKLRVFLQWAKDEGVTCARLSETGRPHVMPAAYAVASRSV